MVIIGRSQPLKLLGDNIKIVDLVGWIVSLLVIPCVEIVYHRLNPCEELVE